MRVPLQPDIIRAAFVTSGARWSWVEFHPAIDSTNDRAKTLLTSGAGTPSAASRGHAPGPCHNESAPAGSPLWGVVLTDHQTGGRGRLDRTWEGPDRAAIAMSVLVPLAEAATASWLPLLAGLALSRAITEVTAAAGPELTPRLKWPNDVLLADDAERKVSGILCELVPAGPEPTHDPSRRSTVTASRGPVVIVGTGVNVDQTRAELPVDTATSLRLAGATIRREDLVIAYLAHLAGLVDPDGDGSGRIDVAGGRAAYAASCSTIGAEVRVHLPTGEIAQGEATGVNPAGGLVVATTRGVRTFAAGDVVHVRNAYGGLA